MVVVVVGRLARQELARLHERSLSAEMRVAVADYVRRAQREEQDEANAP